MAESVATPRALSFAAHPWHGVSSHAQPEGAVIAYIEIVPLDAVKYELDKASGLLRVDRPQRFSSACPTLYGFVPQTYCGEEVGQRCTERTGIASRGDGDPLDICVLSERPFGQGGFLLKALILGGLRMVDAGQADDKLIGVLEGDAAFGDAKDIAEVPLALLDRLRHYFLTYKQFPGDEPRRVRIAETYGRAEALEVLRRSRLDYAQTFGDPASRVNLLGASQH
ncbi:MAG: inorganic pyrophosphatase [Myxococcaceae bacterium]